MRGTATTPLGSVGSIAGEERGSEGDAMIPQTCRQTGGPRHSCGARYLVPLRLWGMTVSHLAHLIFHIP